jgi:polysaccharide export outer membrane protein
MRTIFSFTLALLMLPLSLSAQEQAAITPSSEIGQPAQKDAGALSKEPKETIYSIGETDELNYTLGTNDIVEIKVQSHPELSGMFPLNSEGKIQYEFAGDVAIGGMTRKAAEDKVKEVLTQFVINPKLVFKIVEYHSKSIYVIGQVAKPGKYYIRTKVVPVREAIIEAGMPIPGSAMHRARLITPSKSGEGVIRIVDLNALLNKGDLQYNFEMNSGDQLYVPTTQEEMDNVQVKQVNIEDKPVLTPDYAAAPDSEEVRYTLGPDDIIRITVQSHPEVSGIFPVNSEGKIQMELVGDVYVAGLTKKEIEGKIATLIKGFVDKPSINVNIQEYRSKVYYVIGEVSTPGKFFMRSENITIREAVVEAGLPTLAAAMRKCRLITPAKEGKFVTKDVNLYSVLYEGNLDNNLEMQPGDFLYVPSTVMAKVFRVIAPVAEPVASAASAQTGVNAFRTPTAQ